MDELPTELIVNICDNFDSPRELLAFSAVARRYRGILEACTNLRLRLCRAYFPAFDDALLAIRLQRIPIDYRCHFSLSQNRYSFIPTQDYFQAVMEGRPVPSCVGQSCPSPPPAPWYQELEAVIDLYLLALAFHSTSINGINHNSQANPGLMCDSTLDERLGEITPQYVETYLRTFYRMCVFGSVFRQLTAQPAIDAIEKMTPQEGEDSSDIVDRFRDETCQYPLYRPGSIIFLGDGPESPWKDIDRELFGGFFEWLYAQPKPSNLDPNLPTSRIVPEKCFTEEERKKVALLQVWKLADWSDARGKGEVPDTGIHVKTLFNDTIWPPQVFPTTIYRRTLKISRWSGSIPIINHWAESEEVASIVLELQSHTWAQRAKELDEEIAVDLWLVILTELENRFRVKLSSRLDFMFLPDYGLLNPLQEVMQI